MKAMELPSKAQAPIETGKTMDHSLVDVERLDDENVADAIGVGAFSRLENSEKSRTEWQERGCKTDVSVTRSAESWILAVRGGLFAQRRQAAELFRSSGRRDTIQAMRVPELSDPSGRLAVVDVTSLAQSPGSEN